MAYAQINDQARLQGSRLSNQSMERHQPAQPQAKANLSGFGSSFSSLSDRHPLRREPRRAVANVQGFKVAPPAKPVEFGTTLMGPVKLILRVAKRWKLSDSAVARLLGYRDAAQVRPVLDGLVSLPDTEDMRERVRLVVEFRSQLRSLFGDNAAAEISWLKEYQLPAYGVPSISLLESGRLIDLYGVLIAAESYARQ